MKTLKKIGSLIVAGVINGIAILLLAFAAGMACHGIRWAFNLGWKLCSGAL